jgi:hypothetical protein
LYVIGSWVAPIAGHVCTVTISLLSGNHAANMTWLAEQGKIRHGAWHMPLASGVSLEAFETLQH